MALQDAVRRGLLERAYFKGFHAGTDPEQARKRHVSDTDGRIEGAWRAGFEAGKRAVTAARVAYSKDPLREEG